MSESPQNSHSKHRVLRSLSRRLSGKSSKHTTKASSLSSESADGSGSVEVESPKSTSTSSFYPENSTPIRQNPSGSRTSPLHLPKSTLMHENSTNDPLRNEPKSDLGTRTPENSKYMDHLKGTDTSSPMNYSSTMNNSQIEGDGEDTTNNTRLSVGGADMRNFPESGSDVGLDSGAKPRPRGLTRSSSARAVGLDEPSSDEEDFHEGASSLASFRMERHTNSHSAMLIEAVNDTPSFQASVEYVDIQIKQLDQWLSEFSLKSSRVCHDLDKVKSSVNSVISHFMPSVTHHSVLAQDYTTLLFGRYTESEALFWTDLFATVKHNNQKVHEMVSELQKGIFRRYYDARADYVGAFQEVQHARQELFMLPPAAISIAVRDANVKAWNSYKVMVRAATKLVLIISELESETSLKLLETLSNQFMGGDNGFLNYDQSKIAISSELFRLKTFASKLQSSMPALNAEMKRLRNTVLSEIKKMAPPKQAKSYEGPITTLTDPPGHKVGWINVQIDKTHWNVYWAFIQNGLFGLLGLSKNSTSVTESARLVVYHSEFEVIQSEKDRDNVFRISSGDRSVIMQATNRIDLAQWQAAFNHTKSLAIDKSWSQTELLPWSKEFAITALGDTVAPESQEVTAKIMEINHETTNIQWLQYNSTLTSTGAAAFSSNVPAVKPMPTSVMLEAIIANGFFQPQGIPNAITANFWGSVGHFSESSLMNPTIPRYESSFPDYPTSYPRALVIQDMGMRAFCLQLNPEETPANDDFVVLFFRATTYMFGCEVPARIYATSTKLLFYSCWNGLVALQCVPIEKVLDIDSSHGVGCSELRITIHTSPSTNITDNTSEAGSTSSFKSHSERKTISFNLYIDSSALAERRLTLVLQNRRSRNPLSCEELIEPLGIINLEYAEALKSKEIKQESEMIIRPKTGRSSIEGSQSIKGFNTEYTPHSFGEWLFQESIGERNTLGEEDAYQFGKGMKNKLAQDTFPVNAETLFTVMFAPKSPVFLSEAGEGVVDMVNTVEPWYRNGRRLERRIAQTFRFSKDEPEEKRYNYQKLEHVEHELYVVTERRCAWEMPGGEQFHLVLKYVVYATRQGSHLQIWGRIIWKSKNVSKSTSETVEQFVKMISQTLALKVREAVGSIETLEQANESYGEVKAVKTLSRHKAERFEVNNKKVMRLSARYAARIAVHSPLRHSFKTLRYLVMLLVSSISQISCSLFTLLVCAIVVSLYFNYKLYHQSSNAYWSAYLEQESINEYAKSMHILTSGPSTFTRAIYAKDIDDMVSHGTLWDLSERENDIINQNACSKKFLEIASLSLSATEYGQLYEMEPAAKNVMDRIARMRLDYAKKRNDMMTLIRVLNQHEKDDMVREYQRWIIDESLMCTRARPALQRLNNSYSDNIMLYCMSCLEETKHLL